MYTLTEGQVEQNILGEASIR